MDIHEIPQLIYMVFTVKKLIIGFIVNVGSTEIAEIQKADLCACLILANCSSIDLCSNLPCGEHGICQNNPHNFTCLCDDGFIRDQCKEYNFCVLHYYIFVFLY